MASDFLLLILSLGVFVAITAIYGRQKFSSVYHPISLYLAFHGIVFVLRPLANYGSPVAKLYRAWDFVPSQSAGATVILAANLGLVAFVAGAWTTGKVPLIFRQGAAELDHRRRLIAPFLVALAVLVPLAVASLVGIYRGAWSTMRMDYATGISINTTSNGWFIEAQLMLVPFSVLIAWLFRFRAWALIPLATFVLLRAGTGGRGPFVVACVAAGLLWLYDRKRRWPTLRITLFALLLGASFYLIGQDRGAAVRSFVQDGQVIEVRERSGVLESMDFANFEFFQYLVDTVPGKTGTYGYFVDNLQVVTEPVPRKLWPDKPIGAPIKFFNLFDYGSPFGLTYSLPGEGWLQAGYLGVALWCGLWGLALGAIYARFAKGRQGNFEVAVYFAFLPIFVIAYRDGLLITILRTAVFYLTPVLVWRLAAQALGVLSPHEVAMRWARLRARARAVQEVPVLPRSRRASPEAIVPRAWRIHNAGVPT